MEIPEPMKKAWTLKPAPPPDFLKQFPELPPIVATLLFNRNVTTQEAIDEFLNPDYGQDIHDPFLFRDMRKAVDAIYAAIERKEKIVVHGDYDADGVCAAAVLVSTLRDLGATVDVFLPDREKDGYGLNAKTVEKLAAEQTKLIITADCGISNTPEIAAAADFGVGVIVTDHHTQPLALPERAIALIHPHLEGETYPFKHLAGGGVAWKLASALVLDPRSTLPKGYEKWLLDLAAISSVADMVPLIGESRTIVKYGLIVLQKTRRPGLAALLHAVRAKTIDTTTIGFQIAPRINAAGRMDHASSAYYLLMAKEGEKIDNMLSGLEQQNRDRQMMTEVIVKEAMEQIEKMGERIVYFVHSDAWPSGLLGLVAGRLAQHVQRPVIATCLHDGKYKGSARSIPQINLIEGLQSLDRYLERYGGHPQAAGMTIKKGEEVAFQQGLAKVFEDKTQGQTLGLSLDIDAELKLSEISWELFERLDQFKPYGMKNPKPLYATFGVQVAEVSTVGADQKHLRLVVEHQGSPLRSEASRKKTIAFGFGKMESVCRVKSRLDIVYEIDVNEWNGSRELQLKIVDLRPSLAARRASV